MAGKNKEPMCIISAIFHIFDGRKPKRKRRKMPLTFIFNPQSPNQKITVSGYKIMARIREGQSITVKVNPKKPNGQPGKIQHGTAQWASSDESVATIEQNPDNELEATITPGTNFNGATQITFKGDADLDEGEGQERLIEASGTLELLEAEAETAELEFSGQEA